MKSNTGKYNKVLPYVLISIILFFSINIISSLSFTKYHIDLTEGGMFTISKGSREILNNLDEPITLRFFYSNSVANGVPILKSYAARIRGLLEDYAKYSDGKIKLKIIDPKPFSDEEELAISYGIKGMEVDNLGTKVYIGLAASNSVDEVKIIPVFALEREKYLEYEISRMIYDLDNPKRKKVGVVSSFKLGSGPMLGLKQLGGESDWLILRQIKDTFDVISLGDGSVSTDIPEDVDVLMVVQPTDFSEETLYAIDQYLLGGGKVIMFADPHKEGAGTGNPDDRSFSSNAQRLLASWGIRIRERQIVLDRKAARKFNKGDNPKETWNVVNYLPWLNLREENINDEELITSFLKSININTTGYIESLGFLSVDITPLLESNQESMIIPVNQIRPAKDPEKLLRNFEADNEKYTLAARISGNFKTAYPHFSDRKGHITLSKGKSHLIVVADSDILREENWAQMRNYNEHRVVNIIADNSAFVINSLDHLSGTTELMGLRGRRALSRPFTVVEELRRESEEKFVAKQEELNQKLAETEKKLSDLQKMARANVQNSLIYKKQQQLEIRKFTEEMEQIKKETRQLKGELRENIEDLGSFLKFVNIWLMPILITFFAIFIFMIKKSSTNRKYNQ
jgi:ABC-type uncharacterized transport system involved in gliding motility auxiliary subunit